VESNKSIKEINYDYISEALNLPTEQSFRHFTLKYGDHVMEGATDRKIKFEDAIIMWICREGSCVVSVGNTSYTLSKGHLLFVFPDIFCHFTDISEDFVAETTLARINQNNNSLSLEKSFSKARQLPVIAITKEEDAVITQLLRYIDLSMENWSGDNRLEQDNTTLHLLRGELVEMYRRRRITTKEPTHTEQMVRRFEQLLTINYLIHRDVEWYAETLNLVPKRFSAKVKRVTGKSPSDLIAAEVVKNAKRLLLNSGLTSSEISERLNFATPSFFCRYFKRYVGLSPQEWRTQNAIT
jgi:AraC-like DNA-binding protein